MTELLIQGALSGLLIGGIYGLIALGLNLVFGTMRVVNFAQGTLLMVAMFMAYWLHVLDRPASLPDAARHRCRCCSGSAMHPVLLISPLLAREKAREPMSVLLMTLGLCARAREPRARCCSAPTTRPCRSARRTRSGSSATTSSACRASGGSSPCSPRSPRCGPSSRAPISAERSARSARTARSRGCSASTTASIYNYAFGISARDHGDRGGRAAAVLLHASRRSGRRFLLKAFVIVVLGGLGSMPGAALGGPRCRRYRGRHRHLDAGGGGADSAVRRLRRACCSSGPAGLLGVERK